MQLGLEPALFWSSTPRMVAVLMAGAGKRLEAEHNGRMTQAWLTAAFIAKGRRLSKSDLDRQLIRQASKPQTTAQMLSTARMITAYHGGKVH